MATNVKLNATFDFGDGRDTVNYALESYSSDAAAVSSFKANCINFDQSTDTAIATAKANMISDGGYSCTGIKAAYIETTEKTYYNLNG